MEKREAYEILHYRMLDLVEQLCARFKAGQPCQWDVVPKQRLHRTWEHFSKTGTVACENELHAIYATLRDAVLRIQIGNIVAQHEAVEPGIILDEHLTTDQHEAFAEWLIDDSAGWRISDYGIKPLWEAIASATATSGGTRLKHLDRALNVVHQRGDLSRLLVEGGRDTVIDSGLEATC